MITNKNKVHLERLALAKAHYDKTRLTPLNLNLMSRHICPLCGVKRYVRDMKPVYDASKFGGYQLVCSTSWRDHFRCYDSRFYKHLNNS